MYMLTEFIRYTNELAVGFVVSAAIFIILLIVALKVSEYVKEKLNGDSKND